MPRVLSGVQPTGDVHLGNYLGAFSRWVGQQQPEHFFCIVDLHAMTVPHDPAQLRERTLSVATWLLACGLDPDTVTLFVQSQVRQHSELAWHLSCVATVGELQRMTQYKDKSQGRTSVSVGLFTYPVLMAADILLYQAEQVPVGGDQRQHLELTRDLAQRFNVRFGDTFTVPEPTFPTAGARVMDLQLVDKKMSKSLDSPKGIVLLDEPEDATRRKIRSAVTDSGSQIRAGADKPGVTNLLDLYSAVTGMSLHDLEQHFDGKGYGALKSELAEAVNGVLRPVRARYAELRQDPATVAAVLDRGAERAGQVAEATMTGVRQRLGLSA